MPRSLRPLFVRASALLAGLASVLAACGHEGETHALGLPVSTRVAARGDTPLAFSGRWLAFLADERTTRPGGLDLNGDGDQLDQVAYLVDLIGGSERSLGIAARRLAFLGGELYLAVDPLEDRRAWGPAGTELALVHVSTVNGQATFVDQLDPLSPAPFALAQGRDERALVYARPLPAPLAPFATNLRILGRAAPLAPAAVESRDSAGPLRLRLLAQEQGLCFASASEAASLHDLNEDGDLLDSVLFLLDGTQPVAGALYGEPLVSTRSAVVALEPALLRAQPRGEGNWLVAFLVSELQQGDGSLDRGFQQPPTCPDDFDLGDQVLAFLDFATFAASTSGPPPTSTGIPGGRRIELADPYLATLVREGDWGVCDLNADGDVADVVVAIAPAVAVPFPVGGSSVLRAVADVPGGTHGLASLDGRFVIVVDEQADQADVDGDGQLTHRVVGWLDPRGPLVWRFQQEQGVFLGASWMAPPAPEEHVLALASQEAVLGSSINAPANGGVDADLADSFPVFARFSAPDRGLDTAAAPFAVAPLNAGLVAIEQTGFYRVQEADDGRDWNRDGDLDDFVLRRSHVSGGGFAQPLSVLNDLARPALESEPIANPLGAAFLADERAEGADLNGDGDAEDFVVRWIRL